MAQAKICGGDHHCGAKRLGLEGPISYFGSQNVKVGTKRSQPKQVTPERTGCGVPLTRQSNGRRLLILLSLLIEANK